MIVSVRAEDGGTILDKYNNELLYYVIKDNTYSMLIKNHTCIDGLLIMPQNIGSDGPTFLLTFPRVHPEIMQMMKRSIYMYIHIAS